MEVSIETKNIRMPEHVVSALLAYRQDEKHTSSFAEFLSLSAPGFLPYPE